MKTLIDCDIIEYCLSTAEERQESFDLASATAYKPIYSLPVFEICRSLHLLTKFHNVVPSEFRTCWADFSRDHFQNGEFFVHVSEHSMDNPIRDIIKIRGRDLEFEESPCMDPGNYWDRHYHLIQRLRWLHPVQEFNNGWMASPPEGQYTPPRLQNLSANGDLVIDTNNLLHILNQLPVDGMGLDCQKLHFPQRLADSAIRRFKTIIESYGGAGHLIVPICVLEEAEWVANLPKNREEYQQAVAVLETMMFDQTRPLWNIFYFEPINQEILDHFIFLYESLYTQVAVRQKWQDFGDMLILSFGLYHGCKIASNEWLEGETDVWDVVKTIYPYLVLD